MKHFRFWLILLLVLPISVLIETRGSLVVSAKEETPDVLEGEEEANVEDESVQPSEDGAVSGGQGEDETAEQSLKAHPDADTYFLMTKPTGMGLEMPASKDVSFLVGFLNRGKSNLVVDSMEASFRYAMDFSFHLQNFSAVAYNRVVRPQEEATFAYSFFVSDAYSTRPYGFTVNLYYKDGEGNQYVSAVFNETVSIVELDEGLDGETFFLYLFMAALVILLLVFIQQYFYSKGKKRTTPSSGPEIGTANSKGVDYDWLPEGTLQALNKSPKAPKQSPRQRKVKVKSSDD